jgi:hypothetical protein
MMEEEITSPLKDKGLLFSNDVVSLPSFKATWVAFCDTGKKMRDVQDMLENMMEKLELHNFFTRIKKFREQDSFGDIKDERYD